MIVCDKQVKLFLESGSGNTFRVLLCTVVHAMRAEEIWKESIQNQGEKKNNKRPTQQLLHEKVLTNNYII